MVDADRYPIDVLTQVSAVQALLDKLALALVGGRARHCLIGADGDEKVDKAEGRRIWETSRRDRVGAGRQGAQRHWPSAQQPQATSPAY